jgi:Fur family transcriptional regulator, ferric uptake regulator
LKTRQTRQKESIDRAFRRARRPLSPGEVHALAVEETPTIGLRTVYRRIRELVEEGRLVGIDYPGQPPLYEMVAGRHHPHFICRSCQKVFDLEVDVPDVTIKPPKGFLVDGQETIFYGLCPQCKQNT